MNHQNPVKTLQQVEQLHRNTHAMLHTFWFPLLFWGGVTLLSGLSVALAGIQSLEWFWPIAGTSGFFVMAVYFTRREKNIGVKGSAWPYIALALALMAGAGLSSSFGTSYSKEIGSWLVVSIAYLGFAYLARSWALAGLAAVLGFLAALVGLGHGESYIPLSLAYGLSFIIAGLVAQKAEKRHG